MRKRVAVKKRELVELEIELEAEIEEFQEEQNLAPQLAIPSQTILALLEADWLSWNIRVPSSGSLCR